MTAAEPGGAADPARTPDPDLVTPETGTEPGAASDERRKYPTGALVLLALAAAALWGSSRMTWVTVTSADGLTEPRTDHLNGGVWFGALTPLALVLLASIAAVLATRGWLRRVLGVLIALVGAVAAVPAFALLTNSGKIAERAAKLAELPARAQVGAATTSALPAVLALLGALAAFAAGGLLARMPQDTARLSGKYDNPVFRRAAATEQVTQRRTEAATPGAEPNSTQLSERVLWDALDAGTDPTEDPLNSGGRPDDPDSGEAGGRVR
ncbi:TIGR02234 family membrane protein [Nocardia iowensis]|uniref:TIGR02234 family membrane protein n=1 Tax=Nocardia iowensis TaxID=204891 RepID=A0ABX8RW34_NOCIO|nr:TIGR02234 family membrane protein [Nocardia iowensis]QXN93778.1 TIGR02234 family membrane protein [Nocardia iowensis]